VLADGVVVGRIMRAAARAGRDAMAVDARLRLSRGSHADARQAHVGRITRLCPTKVHMSKAARSGCVTPPPTMDKPPGLAREAPHDHPLIAGQNAATDLFADVFLR
jgi:hypothetical protein